MSKKWVAPTPDSHRELGQQATAFLKRHGHDANGRKVDPNRRPAGRRSGGVLVYNQNGPRS